MTAAYAANPAVLSRSVAETMVLYQYAIDDVVVLDPVGAAIWRRVATADAAITLPELVAALADDFDTTSQRIAASVESFVSDLVDWGGLEPTVR